MANDEQTTAKPDTNKKKSWFWLNDSAGYASVTVTFVTVAFWVTTISYITSIIGKIGPIEFRPFDVAACTGYMTPLMALYFGRKWTSAKMGPNYPPVYPPQYPQQYPQQY